MARYLERAGNVSLGIATAIAIPSAPIVASMLLKFDALGILANVVSVSFGITQWLWIVPLTRSARRKGHVDFARGLTIGAWSLFVPYALIAVILGGTWVLVHLDLTPGHALFSMRDP